MAQIQDPYASIAQPIQGQDTEDPYSSIATTPQETPQSGSVFGSQHPLETLKANYHEALTPQPGKTGHEFMRGMAENLVSPAISAIRHPLDTLGNLGKTAIEAAPPVAMYNQIMGHPERIPGYTTGNDIANEVQQNGWKAAPHIAGEAVGSLMGGELAGGIGKAIGEGGNLLRKGAAGLNNAAMGADMSYGANPGQALSTNHITGLSPTSIASKVESKIPGAVAEHRGIVAAAPESTLINTGPIVNDPFNAQREAKTNPRTGVATTAQIRGANATQKLLTNEIDPSTGKPTMLMRDPNLTPLEATDLKSNLYGMTNYDSTGNSTLSNNALKGSAHGLKSAVEQAVPESIPSGQRLHNLMSAKDTLSPYSASRGLDLSKSGLIKNATMAGATGTAALGDLLGAGAQNVAPAINMIAPPVARLSPFARQRTQDQ
jgi:hypothetical protein